MTTPALGQTVSRLPPADLAASFGAGAAPAPPPNRAATLNGLLTRSPASASPVDAAEATPPAAHADAEPDSPRTETITPRRSKRTKQAAESDTGQQLTIVVYVPASVRDRLRVAAAERGATYTDLTLEALDATHSRLDELITRPDRALRAGSLFSGVPGRRHQRHTEPQVQISLRPTRSDVDVIDRLTDDHAAPSRSALIATALGAHLPA